MEQPATGITRDDLIGMAGADVVATVEEYCGEWSSVDQMVRDHPALAGKIRKEADKVAWRTGEPQRRAAAKKLAQYRFRLPLKINVEVAAVCPLRCEYCVLADLAKYRRAPKMTIGEFRVIWRFMEAFTTEVEFTGGEPLINEDVYEIIVEAARSEVHTTLTTNAQLLTEERIDRVLDAEPTRLLVAYDSSEAEAYETTRRRGTLSTLEANIKRFAERRRERGIQGAELHLQMVVHRKNCHAIDQFWADAEALGADAACIKPILIWPGIGGEYEHTMIDEYIVPDHPMSYHRFDESGALVKKRRPGTCPNVQQCHIGSGSEVIPCWYILKDTFVAGYAADTPFPEIWHSPDYLEYRRRMLEETVTKACEDCIGIYDPTLWQMRRFR